MKYFKPHVGQLVRLNDSGYANVGIRSQEAAKQAERMRITSFHNINDGAAPGTPPIWVIEVDQPMMNVYLLDTSMVTPLEGHSGRAEVMTW